MSYKVLYQYNDGSKFVARVNVDVNFENCHDGEFFIDLEMEMGKHTKLPLRFRIRNDRQLLAIEDSKYFRRDDDPGKSRFLADDLTETALDKIKMAEKEWPSSPVDFQNMVYKLLVGQTVITQYNNRVYKIDDIAWNRTVMEEFEVSLFYIYWIILYIKG